MYAFPREFPGDGLADPSASAHDDAAPAFQSQIHLTSPECRTSSANVGTAAGLYASASGLAKTRLSPKDARRESSLALVAGIHQRVESWRVGRRRGASRVEIEDWKSAGSVAPLYRELRQLGLESNIVELEAFGFTVVPPEKVAPPEFCKGVKEALERAMLRRYGKDGLSEKRWTNINDIQRFMLWEDPIFEQLTYNPAGLGLAQWLLGTDCVLSLCAAWVKGPGEVRTGIHGDYLDPALVAQPEPANNCNMHYMLTDYTKDDGSISFVPGSHR
ncbi:MAG: hypothetical protein F4Y01_16655, partial [Gammaproteobacteria bacterium]|nr:hypothetical protein [Gammaproteobacteria bacterium]